MIETAKSFCRVCHAACAIEVDIEREEFADRGRSRVLKVRGDESDPLFEGYACIKGRALPEQIHHPDRILSALRRAPMGGFDAISSETALDEVAAKLQAIITEHGPRAVATYTGTGGYQNSVSVELTRRWHKAIGSPSFYTSVTIDQPAKATAPSRIGSWWGGFHQWRQIAAAQGCVIALGYNSPVSSYAPVGGLQGTNPLIELKRAKKAGLFLVVVDPRRTELASYADLHLQVMPGEDAPLLAAMLNVILSEGLHDHAFCEAHVAEIAELAEAVRSYSPEYAAGRCGVPADDIVTAARRFATGPKGSAGNGTGPGMAPHPSLSEHLAIAMNVVCGFVNREGDTVPNPWAVNAKRPWRAEVIAPDPDFLNKGAKSRFRGLSEYRGEMPTNALSDEILGPGDGQVRALIVLGGNPVVAWPDQQKTAKALSSLECLVVLDHRMSATAELAHYVVGARLSLERADVPHLMDRWFEATYTNYTPAVIEPQGDVQSEWELIWGLSKRMGTTVKMPGGLMPVDVKPTDDDMIDLLYTPARVSPATIRTEGRGRIWDLDVRVEPAQPGATARFTVAPPDIVAELVSVRREANSLEVLAGYEPEVHTFRLASRRLKQVLNSLGPELPLLAHKGTTNYAYLHPSDLDGLGVVDGDLIEITSPRASLVGVAMGASDIKRGVISMAHSWGGTSSTDENVRTIGSPTNRLISNEDGYDRITGHAVQSAIPVSVRRFAEPAAVGPKLI